MNLRKITEFYPWEREQSLRSKLVLCLDKNNGEFSFVHFLLKHLKQQSNGGRLTHVINNDRDTVVHLFSCNHSRIHYESIFRKSVSDVVAKNPQALCAMYVHVL